jgi:hypothetical protein
VYTTHAVLILSDDALAIHDPCSWTDRKVTKGHPHGQSWEHGNMGTWEQGGGGSREMAGTRGAGRKHEGLPNGFQ